MDWFTMCLRSTIAPEVPSRGQQRPTATLFALWQRRPGVKPLRGMDNASVAHTPWALTPGPRPLATAKRKSQVRPYQLIPLTMPHCKCGHFGAAHSWSRLAYGECSKCRCQRFTPLSPNPDNMLREDRIRLSPVNNPFVRRLRKRR